MKPDVPQRPDQDSEISSTGGTEQAGDVLDEDPSARSNKLVGDSCELEEEAAASSGEPGALAGDGEVLAGEPSDEDIDDGCGPVHVET